jgi:hypothetical protein
MINLVIISQAQGAERPEPKKVSGRLFFFHIGTHGQEHRRGIVGTYAIVSKTRNTVSPYRCHIDGKANRKER